MNLPPRRRGPSLSLSVRAGARRFVVSAVSAAAPTYSGGGERRVTVTVAQRGVAPFYYPLSLSLSCEGFAASLPGVEAIIAEGDSATFTFEALPAGPACLGAVTIALRCGRLVSFDQSCDQSNACVDQLYLAAVGLLACTTCRTQLGDGLRGAAGPARPGRWHLGRRPLRRKRCGSRRRDGCCVRTANAIRSGCEYRGPGRLSGAVHTHYLNLVA